MAVGRRNRSTNGQRSTANYNTSLISHRKPHQTPLSISLITDTSIVAVEEVDVQFRPAVREWFQRAFPKPTRAQQLGWPAIARGDWTLIFAPTGSGKTLTAFLWALDRLMFAPRPPKERRCRVVYISPLKALAVDGERNLRAARAIRAALDRHSQRRHAPGGGGALPPRPRRHPDHHAGVDLPDADLERA